MACPTRNDIAARIGQRSLSSISLSPDRPTDRHLPPPRLEEEIGKRGESEVEEEKKKKGKNARERALISENPTFQIGC